MTKLIAFIALLTSVSAHAYLPPLAESLRRIRAITESPAVYEAFGSARELNSITQDDNGVYTLVSAECMLKVTVEPVVAQPVRMVPELKVTVGTLTCLAQ